MIKFPIGKKITTIIHSQEFISVSRLKSIVFINIKNPINKNNLEKEFQFFQNDFAKGFERTYGWAWLMLLYSELETWDDIEAKNWSKNLKPLVDLLSERTIIFLNKLSKPLRPGTHANTAFSFSLMYEYAQKPNNETLLNI